MGMRIIKLCVLASVILLSCVTAKRTEHIPLPSELQSGMPVFGARIANSQDFVTLGTLKNHVKPETKRVVFAFFATWCVPCIEGIKLLKENQNELKKNGVQVILINAGEEDNDKISSWVQKYASNEWLLLLDPFLNLFRDFGFIGKDETQIALPKTLLLDSNLEPIALFGAEGNDFPKILWSFK